MEISKPPPNNPTSKQRKRTICLSVLGIILLLVILILILSFTVFKPKHPITTVNSVVLDDFDVSLDVLHLKFNLNLTLAIDLSIKNPNKVGFKFANSSVFLYYDGGVVGEAPVPANEISGGETLPMNVSLTLMADRLLSNTELYSDLAAGTLPVSTSTRISGKVIILKVFKVHVVSETTCDVKINVSNRTVEDQVCKYKTKI